MTKTMTDEKAKKLHYVVQPVFRKAVLTLIQNPDMKFNKSELADKADVSRDALYSYWQLLEDEFLKTHETRYSFDTTTKYVDIENRILLLQSDNEQLMQVVKPVFRKALITLLDEQNIGDEYNLSKLSKEADVSRDALYNYKTIFEDYLLDWNSERKFVLDATSEHLDMERKVLRVPVS